MSPSSGLTRTRNRRPIQIPVRVQTAVARNSRRALHRANALVFGSSLIFARARASRPPSYLSSLPLRPCHSERHVRPRALGLGRRLGATAASPAPFLSLSLSRPLLSHPGSTKNNKDVLVQTSRPVERRWPVRCAHFLVYGRTIHRAAQLKCERRPVTGFRINPTASGARCGRLSGLLLLVCCPQAAVQRADSVR